MILALSRRRTPQRSTPKLRPKAEKSSHQVEPEKAEQTVLIGTFETRQNSTPISMAVTKSGTTFPTHQTMAHDRIAKANRACSVRPGIGEMAQIRPSRMPEIPGTIFFMMPPQ